MMMLLNYSVAITFLLFNLSSSCEHIETVGKKQIAHHNKPKLDHYSPSCKNFGTVGSIDGIPKNNLLSLKGGLSKKQKKTLQGASLKQKNKNDPPTKEKSQKISLFIPIVAAMNYYLSLSFVIPVLPKIVNEVVSGAQSVTAKSASLYGTLSGIDGLFTFLTVNAAGSLSDKYGRKPFMCLASLGLGTGFLLSSLAKKAWLLMLASTIDGCTSCMYAIANAYVADVTEPEKRPQAFGVFQGVALGLSFMFGIPLGGIIGKKTHIRVPLYIAATLCALNALFVLLIPEPVSKESRQSKKINLATANPWGAAKMLGQNKLLSMISAAYLLIWIAHSGVQINWINFTQHKFGWNVAQSGMSLCLMGILVAITPKLLIPIIGTRKAIGYGTLMLAFANFFLALAPKGWMLVLGLGILGLGSIVFPATLSFLTNQVDASEVGAMQGAADTVKTLTTSFAYPLSSLIFGYSISDKASYQFPGAFMIIGGSVLLLSYVLIYLAMSRYGHLSKSNE